jgi:hypothetical protein
MAGHVAQGFESRDVTRVERGSQGLGIVGGALLLLVLGELYVLARGDVGVFLSVSRFVAPLVFFLSAFLRNLWLGSLERTKVRANRHGLWIGEEFIPSSSILSARPFARGELAMVRFRRDGLHLPLDLGVADAPEGERLVRALDLDGTGRGDLEIGADGILLRGEGRRRYLHHARIARASLDPRVPDQIALVLRDGEHVAVPCRPGRAVLTLAQIEQGMAACASDGGGEGTAEATLLDRRGRDLRGWIEELRALGTGARAAHRVAPVSSDHLWRIVESAGARPPIRLAAALALGPRLDGRDRDRLRATASATTSPRLRIALEGAANAAPPVELEPLITAVEADEGPGSVAERRTA